MTWGQIGGTLSNQTDLQNALNAKENTITSGTTAQYFRGDKTFQTLDKTAVGLGNVDNTSDANKPISTATQTALNAKQDSLGFTPVPTTRTLTINGVAQDLSADRSWTISTGLTVGTTPIASGTIGRVLFQGTGNVLQQSSSLFWDSTNNRLGIGTSTPAYSIDVVGETFGTSHFLLNTALPNRHTQTVGFKAFWPGANSSFMASTSSGYEGFLLNTNLVRNGGVWACQDTTRPAYSIGALYGASSDNFFIQRASASSGTANLVNLLTIPSTGNVLINTTTDAGFRLDVNGTARVQSGLANNSSSTAFQVTGASGSLLRMRGFGDLYLEGGTPTLFLGSSGTFVSNGSANFYSTQGAGNTFFSVVHNNSNVAIRALSNSNVLLNPSAGNVLIGTTTDAGFRLDVNGTARVGNAYLGAWSLGATYARFGHTSYNSSLPFGFLQEQNGNAYMNGTTSYIGATNNVIFDTNAVEKMRIISNGNILIGTTTDVASSLVTMSSTTKGFLPPRMTTTQKNAIASPAAGLVVYDTTLAKLCVYTTTWETITSL
jgi:hypothetical protein